MKIAYWPVAFELEISEEGRIIIGHETTLACNRVLQHVQRKNPLEYVVIPSAGVPKEDIWSGVCVSELMASYIIDNGLYERNVRALKAKKFNTQGEAKAVVDFLKDNNEIKTLIICVKWWHALRCWNWVHLYLKKYNILDVDVKMEICESFVQPKIIEREFWLAHLWNLFRMWYVLKFT